MVMIRMTGVWGNKRGKMEEREMEACGYSLMVVTLLGVLGKKKIEYCWQGRTSFSIAIFVGIKWEEKKMWIKKGWEGHKRFAENSEKIWPPFLCASTF